MVEHAADSIVKAKEAAGNAAAAYVKEGMIIGLGTGSTTHYFIKSLGERCRQGLKIQAVSSSERSADIAQKFAIPLVNIDEIDHINLTIDGADEIDSSKAMIKGGGGALLREKILASQSDELIIIVDETKCVNELGKFPLPVEIATFGFEGTLRKLSDKGYEGRLRSLPNGKPFITDNGNYIADIHFSQSIKDPSLLDADLKRIVGVLETGIFVGLASRVIVGFRDGHVEIRD